METSLAVSIKDILDFGDENISSLEAQIRLLSLASTAKGPQQNVIRAIESLIPTWKDVDLQSLSEGHLIASYVHPLIQSLLAVDSPSKISHCSNTQIATDDLDQRPDYVVDVYQQYQFSHPSCFGEIKIKNTTDTLSQDDLYRLAILYLLIQPSKKKSRNMPTCFFFLGSRTTFFYMTLLAGIYVFCEVSSVTIPTTKQSVV
ncbi:hypothetical protein DM01DRAFT_1396009 [Hesseltinella vesiculosa]|uniref:Uncharacterized protein n=1 Tax=Hesseltinella vesiculosa TaxID=101127 RepID=A0A1X2G8A8_9FUNG|nr:hypothetical protein DM01DRAFT_1396009 [Hesseltinella vesiculosa]